MGNLVRLLFTAIALLVTAKAACGQQIVKFTVDDGLSQSFATSIVQDQTGFIWIGTLNGLNRFDGNDFKVYYSEGKSNRGLLSNFIKTLTLDGNGRLWVGSQKGLQYYDENSDRFITPPALKRDWIWNKEPTLLVQDNHIFLINKDSLIEFAIREAGSAILVEEVRTCKFPSEEFGNPFVLMKRGGMLWIGAELGVCLWDGDNFQRFYPEIEAEKRTDKVSVKLLGRLSETDGFIPSAKQSSTANQVDLRKVDIKTFGVFGLFQSLLGAEINGILSLFKREVSEILLIVALCRFAHQSAIKRMPHYHSTDYSSEHWSKGGINAKNITQALGKVGENREVLVAWMQKRIACPPASLSNFLMIDSTHIPTVSENLNINAAGYNALSSFDKQIRLMYIFSSELKQPVYYRLINSNIADISSMKTCVEELNVKPVVFIADKGFYSKNNTSALRENKMHFIIPLRRDNKLIDYTFFQNRDFKKGAKYFFTYQNRIIWYYEYQVKNNFIITYLDDELRVREEKDFLNRCGTHPEVYTLEKFEAKINTFGTLSLMYELPLKPTPEELYQTYKQRNEVEVMFDAYKHFLEADKTYMQDRHVFEGWLMANFIAMIAYYRLYAALKEAGKLSNTSPKDVVEFSKSVYKMRSGGTWITTETTAKVRTLLNSLKIDYLNEQS